jgi:hypothetical protein
MGSLTERTVPKINSDGRIWNRSLTEIIRLAASSCLHIALSQTDFGLSQLADNRKRFGPTHRGFMPLRRLHASMVNP